VSVSLLSHLVSKRLIEHIFPLLDWDFDTLFARAKQLSGPSTATLLSIFPTLISVESLNAGMRNAVVVQQALRKVSRQKSEEQNRQCKQQAESSGERQVRSTPDEQMNRAEETKRKKLIKL
jgi:hypothetical protein